jgi:uncharacterized metal-binding protein YceD (DUF177 family)
MADTHADRQKAQAREDRRPWNTAIKVERIPQGGLGLRLVADEAERATLARDLRLPGIARAEAVLDIVRRHGAWHVTGQIEATVTQVCGVTLEPFEAKLREPVEISFSDRVDPVPADGEAAMDAPDPLEDGRIDLGAVAAEFLALGLDPYPRKPGVTFAAPDDGNAEMSPFAALKGLVGKGGGKGDGEGDGGAGT